LLTRLSQFGWDIEYGRYNDSDVVVMPYKMTARRQNQTVKLVVRRWFLTAAGNLDE
jgi:outer membrane biogenesis lipoprotein LolB